MAEAATALGTPPAAQQGGNSPAQDPTKSSSGTTSVFTPEQQKGLNTILAKERRTLEAQLAQERTDHEAKLAEKDQLTTQLSTKITSIETLLREIAGIEGDDGEEPSALDRFTAAETDASNYPEWVKTPRDRHTWRL